MALKHSLTTEQQVIEAYWPHIFRLYEEVFLDLANLAGRPGANLAVGPHVSYPGFYEYPDSAACTRFRQKWSEVFHDWPDDATLLELRDMIRLAIRLGYNDKGLYKLPNLLA